MPRTVFLKIHLWAGMAAAVFLFALGLSGALLTFEGVIDPALNAHFWYVKPQGSRLTLTQIEALVLQAFPQSKVQGMDLQQKRDESVHVFVVQLNGREVGIAVNPYTGEILGRSDQLFRPMLAIRGFHTHLLIRRGSGQIIVTAAACCLFGLEVTGLMLWWPRKISKVRRGASQRVVFDLHQMIGLWSSACVLVFALTGMTIGFEDQVGRWAAEISHVQSKPWPRSKPHEAGMKALSPDELVAKAESIAPGALPVGFDLGDGADDPPVVFMKFPEDHTSIGRTRVILDQYTGEVLRFENTRTMPMPVKYARLWNIEIHTGDIFGWPTRILACVFSLAVTALAITGPWIWWNRTRLPKIANGRGSVVPTARGTFLIAKSRQ